MKWNGMETLEFPPMTSWNGMNNPPTCLEMPNNCKVMNQLNFPKKGVEDLLGEIKCLHLVTLLGDDGKEDC
jgi:hypothetical protein